MSAHTNAICARVINTLHRLNKEILTPQDVNNALAEAGIDSTDGQKKYAKNDGYLVRGGWLIRCIGGWILAPETIPSGVIIVKVVPGMATGMVFKRIDKALEQYKSFVTMEIAVSQGGIH